MIRDDSWLEGLLESVWRIHFSDIEERYPLRIIFGKRARTRLGSLSYDKRHKLATLRVTGLFRDSAIPEYVVKATIVHELCHYSHGFHSGHEQKFDYPHAGGVVRREFTERGMEKLYVEQKKWLKKHWRAYVMSNFPTNTRRMRLRRIGFRV